MLLGFSMSLRPPGEIETSTNVRSGTRLQLIVLASYVCIAIAFAWPLPLHLNTALPGPISEDTGVYVWNLWVFRHQIVAHHQLPFSTLEIMSLAPPVPLALHNYTAAADLVAFPLLPLLGTVRTFNVLIIASGVLSAFVMFLYARRVTRDASGAWLAGVLFGFSPFMSARTSEHFSLVQTAPLVLFALLFDRLQDSGNKTVAVATGAVVAIAYLCDPYYAVYCILIGSVAVAHSAIVVHDRDVVAVSARWLRITLDIIIACIAALILSIGATGGGHLSALGVRVSMTQFYTPVLLLTVAVCGRIWLVLRPRIRFTMPTALPRPRHMVIAALTCGALLAPVLTPVVAPAGERQWISPKVFWRSSAAGLDLLTVVTPNPMHPWFGGLFRGWLASLPHTVIENIASIPWSVIAVLAFAAWRIGRFAPRYWIVFTVFFGSLALGPFVHIYGHNLYIPTPWTLLRYLPIVGAARMPTRMIAVVMLGVAMLLAFAVRDLKTRVRRPALFVAAVSVVLLFELLPSPRRLYSAAVPHLFDIVAADPRPLSVLSLPFGLRDGMRSFGNASPTSQFFQTHHGKRLLGGYVSRLPSADVAVYTRRRVTAALMQLSEGRHLSPERRAEVVRRARQILPELKIGYVVVNRSRASQELIDFAREAFDLEVVTEEGERTLYRTPLATPPTVITQSSGRM